MMLTLRRIPRHISRRHLGTKSQRMTQMSENSTNFSFSNLGISGDIAGPSGDIGDDDGDFSEYVRRRVHSFYIGGFKRSITEVKLSVFVSNRGPTITKLLVIRNKRFDSAFVKMNVEDNEQATWLENPFFWPRGIVCRPWITQTRESNERDIHT